VLLGTGKRKWFGLRAWFCNRREEIMGLLVPGAFFRTTGGGVDGGAAAPPTPSIVGERRF